MIRGFLAICLLTIAAIGGVQAQTLQPLAEKFREPPADAKPHTWWHWMAGHVSREGITKDLEAMQRLGLGGFQAFHISYMPAGPLKYGSPEWHEMMKHTIREADRLGLEMCFHNCPGFSSTGGPWITPEYSMQTVVSSELRVTGPQKFSGPIAQPKSNRNYYREIAVLAFPTPAGETDSEPGFRLEMAQAKAGYQRRNSIPRDKRIAPAGVAIKLASIVNLSDKLEGNMLDWDVPEGEWTIVRFGYTTTGAVCVPAPREGVGLEVDKLNPVASEIHWRAIVDKVLEDAGPLAGKVLNNILIDSYETGQQNWTHAFAEEFTKRTDYDITPYLPALTGRVIENVDITERFLWDYRRTIADLFRDNYFGKFAELCHEHGLVLSCEPYGAPGNFNDPEIAAIVDIPMGEFWSYRRFKWHEWSVKLSASAANAHGKRYVGAESFTTSKFDAGWTTTPAVLKPLVDRNYAQGLNRVIFHTFVHQPWGDHVKPGMTMFRWGMHMNRNNTWFEQSKPFVEYLSRCQAMLQEGRAVIDICYLVSENSPATAPFEQDLSPKLPVGYDYDALAAADLMKMKVVDGQIVLPSGMTYRALVLPPDDRMRPHLLAKAVELAEAGALIHSQPITAAPGLRNFPENDAKVASLTTDLLNGNAATTTDEEFSAKLTAATGGADFTFTGNAKPEDLAFNHRRHGEFEVYFVANQLDRRVTIEASFRDARGNPELWWPESGTIETAWQWAWMNGRGNGVRMPLTLEPAESVFVVFLPHLTTAPNAKSFEGPVVNAATPPNKLVNRLGFSLQTFTEGEYQIQPWGSPKASITIADLPAPMAVETPWKVTLPQAGGPTTEIELAKLQSLATHADEPVKHFSGTAEYRTTITINAAQAATHVQMLDLGDVQVVAEVELNGKPLGTLWKKPFRVDLSGKLQEGPNELVVRVTNNWINRLIGDQRLTDRMAEGTPTEGLIKKIPDWVANGVERPAAAETTFATWGHFKPDDKLVPSGLIGPVKLHFGTRVPIVTPK